MQDTPPRKPQYIDGFVRNRQHRTIVSSASQATPVQGARIQRHAGQSTVPRPMGDFNKPIAPKLAAKSGERPLINTSLPVRDMQLSGKRASRFGKKQKNPRSWKTIAKRSALVVLALFMVSGGWLGWKVYRNSAKVFGNKNPLSVLSAFKPVALKGQSSGHVNILLAGNSADRTDGSGGSSLIDSMMIVSINTKEHTAFMMSIPRDLWVNVPGVGYGKINTVGNATNFSQSGLPSGNMGALESIVADDFGIDINYYALVNYTAFKDAVNSVGGIDVNVQSEDARGLYDPSFRPSEGGPLKLANGVQHLDGQMALNLARARGDPFNGKYGAYGFPKSDFDRTEHQRWMMLALKEKVISAGTLSNPVKVGKLMDAVGNNVKTDFQINELASLYYLMKDVKSSDIESLSLNEADGVNLLANYTGTGGQSALAPAAGVGNYDAIQQFITKKYNANKITKESANVVVLNGGQIVGLAKTYGDILAKKGVNVSQVGDAPATASSTVVIDNSAGKKPNTKALLKQAFGNGSSTDTTLAQQYNADFVVILGANQSDPTAGSSSTSN